MIRHGKWTAPLVLLLAVAMMLIVIGCDDDDDNDLDGRFPYPDSGNVAIVTITHRQLETGREPLSYGEVEVLIDGARTTDAVVTLADQALYYDSRDQAYSDQLTPALVPSASSRVRIRSFTWGEDTTYVFLPGDFDLNHPTQGTFSVGNEFPVTWTASNRCHRYILRIGIVDSTNSLLVDTLGTDVLEYAWTIPEAARDHTLRVKLAAHRTLNDPPVWSGTSETYSDFTFSVGP
ncbi:hypothetical protein KQI63_08130 [bacterium]|nr:hypothetical protein [bacterium]